MSENHARLLYPFSAIVAQDRMKTALILNAINPSIGGVLIRGERGTAKSTAVRSLATLLPDMKVVHGCPFGCDPADPETMCADCRRKYEEGTLVSSVRKMRVVELPVSSTEDKVVGTLDIGEAIKSGEKRFDPGVLAEANRNILYVDEVNLLNDHIVDVLLDAAAMGLNTVEREGISFSHPANFILVGTMNPEEGDLRPQLLDRFGLSLDIRGERDVAKRAEVVKRRVEFDSDPESYVEACQKELDAECERLTKAKQILPKVTADDDIISKIVSVTINFGVDGHRADITMLKAAKANAALEGRTNVIKDDIRATAELVLAHRLKRRPFEEAGLDREELEKCLQDL